MERSKIKMLLNLFENKQDLVWVMDENWKIIGGKYYFSNEISVPYLLNVNEECWENFESDIYLNEHFHHCCLYCSKEEGFRVMVLKDCRLLLKSEQENIDIKIGVHNLQLIKEQIHEYIQKHPDSEFSSLPDSLERISLLIYRKYYLEKLIQSVQNNKLSKSPFSIQNTMQTIQPHLSELFENYAEISMHLPTEPIYFHSDENLFKAILLCGIILSHQKRGCFHHLEISLTSSKNTAQIKISMKPEPQKTIDMSLQLDSSCYGTTQQEETLLNLFCMMHDGKWTVSNKKKLPVNFSLTFSLSKVEKTIQFQTYHKNTTSKFEDPYKLLLAPIYISKF